MVGLLYIVKVVHLRRAKRHKLQVEQRWLHSSDWVWNAKVTVALSQPFE